MHKQVEQQIDVSFPLFLSLYLKSIIFLIELLKSSSFELLDIIIIN